jgi:hypothetical protein
LTQFSVERIGLAMFRILPIVCALVAGCLSTTKHGPNDPPFAIITAEHVSSSVRSGMPLDDAVEWLTERGFTRDDKLGKLQEHQGKPGEPTATYILRQRVEGASTALCVSLYTADGIITGLRTATLVNPRGG